MKIKGQLRNTCKYITWYRSQANAVIELPMGAEDQIEAIIDGSWNEGFKYTNDSGNWKSEEIEIPEDDLDRAEEARASYWSSCRN